MADASKSPSAQKPESANAAPPPVEEGDLSDDSLDGDVMLELEYSELESTLVALDIKKDIMSENTKAKTDKPKRVILKPPRTLETTLFERLERMYGAGIKRMLKVQYR